MKDGARDAKSGAAPRVRTRSIARAREAAAADAGEAGESEGAEDGSEDARPAGGLRAKLLN
jgi:hypothetical protein